MDRKVTVALVTSVVPGFLVDVREGVEADVAGQHLFHLEIAGAERQDTGVGVRISLQNILDNPHQPRMAGEHDQQPQEAGAGNPDQMATLDAGGYDPGMADSVGSYDAGGFSDFGGDFGGGDFGG